MSAPRLPLLLLLAVAAPAATGSELRKEAPGLPDSETPTRPRVEHLTHTVIRTAPWFVSPRPGAAPNGFLERGMRVQLLSVHGGYARVWTEGGAVFAGYVSREVLQELSLSRDAGP